MLVMLRILEQFIDFTLGASVATCLIQAFGGTRGGVGVGGGGGAGGTGPSPINFPKPYQKSNFSG